MEKLRLKATQLARGETLHQHPPRPFPPAGGDAWPSPCRLLLVSVSALSPRPPACFRAGRGPGADTRRDVPGVVLVAGQDAILQGGGGVRREPGPVRLPYPRLGPFGTNQGPAMPMRPQNVVKMMTGRAKECAVMAGARDAQRETGERGRCCGSRSQEAEGRRAGAVGLARR